ncbi:tRNA (guanine-N7-)-methyltransferase [Faunimonas pinastri]|uniref:tRNA (guanine-N(7)-)-methyltransferase n=1 Tax=Faunimonas pinastri TaxID=1855383 RepID=A0A1H9PS22_9HYPH|nr:tRNA (guanine(46)-N(7))-methyltransferase TrmB [Faunimonas pinastri]SER50908.1 tRNA (guanine-N7-)-methyltransferase [Faunimonas pinastri]
MTGTQRTVEYRESSFFGRRKGKALRAGQRLALEQVLPALKLDLDAPAPAALSELFPVPVGSVRLEIGFGGAEHLLHEAGRHPEVGYIGVEPFQNGMVKAIAGIEETGIPNVRLYDEEAGPLMDWLPPASLERVDLLYPDPWPKPRHWKRRFVNADNLARIVRALRPGGEFRFASDIASYVRWTLAEVASHGGLVPLRLASEVGTAWPGWPGTRYEAKAIREGRPLTYLSFRKPE